jgi:lipoate-protein ligase A
VDLRIDCAANVRADEALLLGGGPAVRVGVLSDHALSVGVGTGPGARCLVRARTEKLAVVRRSSGGTGVLHAPGDIAWSIVLPRTHPMVGRDFVHAYDRLGRGVTEFLRTQRQAAIWEAAPGLSEDCCLLGKRGRVLTVEGRVLGGAAQHATGRALLHHGILPRRIDRAMVQRVFGLSSPGPVDRLTDLAELGLTEGPAVAARKLADAIAGAVTGAAGNPSD